MAWIKRNLIFVICVAVGVALMGVAIFFLIGSLSDNQDLSDKFQQSISELNTLRGKTPSPTQENIDLAKAEKERMKDFLGEFRKSFALLPPPPVTDDKGFKAYLQSTIAELQSDASNAAVQLPPNYAFSFASQVEKLNISTECIQPWMQQLQEIKAICSILYGAKVNYLQGLQRVPTCKEDAGGNDYLGTTSVTNQVGVTTPYRVSFLSFSSEIAAVLDGFQRSSNCFIVKNIEVSPAKIQAGVGVAAAPAYAPSASAAPTLASRAALRNNPGAAATAPAHAVTGGAAVPILWEKQLLVTLTVDVLKLKPAER